MEDDRYYTGGQRLRAPRKPWRRSSPRSLEGVSVWVSRIEGEAARDGLDGDRVMAEVQWRLAAAGIPVFQHQEGGVHPVAPCLGVLLHLRKADVIPAFYTFSVEVFFVQAISAEGDPSTRTMQMTWCKETIGEVRRTSQGSDWSCVYDHIGALVDAFSVSYLRDNPRSKPSLLIN